MNQLNPEEREQLKNLIVYYKHWFPDAPSKTDIEDLTWVFMYYWIY